MAYENGLNLKATELRLGLPGTDHETEEAGVRNRKRQLPEEESCLKRRSSDDVEETAPPPAK